ncbi:MAG: hypothetical protein MUE81_04045 [Thermoflexibacter sp.]|jgi:hypothetical protein|nr:hypothetical protein [Thermoflexibacter sp.]
MGKKDTTTTQKQARKSKVVATKKKKTKTALSKSKNSEKEVIIEQNDKEMIPNNSQAKKLKKRKIDLERLTHIAKKMQEIRRKAAKSKI